ncbi:MgtC/SapB family protein [Caldalkalibacillus mannanilyticus]|uniref:MgtC/SapB family protein n=1 Tax=Caldalkalibacillus mannanilyticus TaxID=1418 RepID=UPI0004699EDF|nr:MgtC/SapB family protein [Caldalkalibacillus mannanilyticus]
MAYLGYFYDVELYFKIILSAGLGFLLGLDRTTKNKPAGMKTYTYVCVACTLITIISIESVTAFSGSTNKTVMDPMRLAAQVVSGLGFLGAGVILKDGLRVKGLTSAAIIFFCGGVGIGIGAGFYGIVIFSVVMTYLFSVVGNFFWKKSNQRLKKAVSTENTLTL